MEIKVEATVEGMGKLAAAEGAAKLRAALEARGEAAIIVATGASQFSMLAALVEEPGIAWDRVTVFHLDEYVGLPIEHPASFRKYLWERFASRLPLPVKAFHYINAEVDPEAECQRLAALIGPFSIDVAFIGIGENGHIAFNDPPADFDTVNPYLVVDLDEACQQQQLGEGWFPTFDDVPQQAISMSVREIMRSKTIICTVPDERKAEAVRNTVEGGVTPEVPASILQQHADCTMYLDSTAASRLAHS